jgi:hypothetical protein
VPLPVVTAEGAALVDISKVGGTNEMIVSEEAALAETIEYDHVPLPTVGTIRVCYSQIEPLMPRRFHLEDDLP